MLDGNIMALMVEEQRIQKQEENYERFLEIVESSIGEELDELTAQFNSIAEDFNIEETFLEYVNNR